MNTVGLVVLASGFWFLIGVLYGSLTTERLAAKRVPKIGYTGPGSEGYKTGYTGPTYPSVRATGAAHDLACACLEGILTRGNHHESWCPFIKGDYDGLVRLEL